MELSPYMMILRLIIQGAKKRYEATFKEGLNLVWGDMDSGKSSILNLIDYCLGGKNRNLLYGEMRANGRVAFLEVDINGKVFTFERDILSEASPIRVYTGFFDDRSSHYPMLMSASPADDSMPDGWLSNFILDNLGIAKVAIKESRFREDASSDRLSFRDLMKLMYLRQTRVGSDSLLDFQSPALFSKNVEIQKFVFNVYDDKLAGLQTELANELSENAELEKNQRFIRKFLRDVNIDIDKFENSKEEVGAQETRLTELDESIASLKEDFVLATDVGSTISNAISQMRFSRKKLESRLQEIEARYASFVKLENTYNFDLEALKLSKLTRSVIDVTQSRGESVACPLCFTQVQMNSPAVEDEDIEHKIKSLRNRQSGIQSVLMQLRDEQRQALTEKNALDDSIAAAGRSFDENHISSISPLITSIEAIEITRTQVKIDLAEAEKNMAISNKFIDIGAKLEIKDALISNLRRSIRIIKEQLIGLDDVLNDLSVLMDRHMRRSGLQNVSDVFIDKKFTAFFRGISYYDTSSGGVRTITSIALFVTRLEYIIKNACNLPTFLMIDTPGQNIGRYRSGDDVSEVSDPQLYENIFKQIIEVTVSAKKAQRKCQVIVVDNDMPESLKENVDFHLVKHFSKQGGKFEKGLINDA
ncbi:AAA family ATPase [Paraburkholderia sp. SIMBA_049]